MKIVIRCNYGDESLALIQWFYENRPAYVTKIVVCYINTGWAASTWEKRVKLGEKLAKGYGFETVQLDSHIDFASLARQQNGLPTQKFQWCAGFLKGIPFLDWLDEVDSRGEWVIAIPKRQSLYRKPIPEYIEQCDYHGERKIWHPMVNIDTEQRDQLLHTAGFKPLYHRSLECEPCVNARINEIQNMSLIDLNKAQALENELNVVFYPKYNKKIKEISKSKTKIVTNAQIMDSFSMGCGDPFGCGL